MCPCRGVFVAHDLINRGEVASPVVVALQLVDAVTPSEKFGGVVRRVPEGCLDEFGRLTLSDCISDRIIEARVEDNYDCETIRVGRSRSSVAGFRLLIEQFSCPAVHRPVQERQCRAGSFHLHALLVTEACFSETSACCHKVIFVTPNGNRRRGDSVPALRFCQQVVNACDLRVVEISRVGNKPYNETLLYIVLDLGCVPGSVLARNQNRIPLALILVVFLLQPTRVLRQRMRERVRDTRQRLRRLAPKFRLADTPFALLAMLTVRPFQYRSERIQNRGIVGVFVLLLRRQKSTVGQLIGLIKMQRSSVRLDALYKRLAFRLYLQIRIAAVNFRFVFQRETVDSIQSRTVITATANSINFSVGVPPINQRFTDDTISKFCLSDT